MISKLIKTGALAFAAGAVVGAAGAMWLMSESGQQVRDELRDLANQAKDKMQAYCDQIKQETEAVREAVAAMAKEAPAAEAEAEAEVAPKAEAKAKA